MMLFLRRVVGAVLLIAVARFSAGLSATPLHPRQGWLAQALLHSTILLLLTAVAGWLMMRRGGGAFPRRVRMCGMALIVNSLISGSFLSLTPAYYGLFGNPAGSMMQQVVLEHYMAFDLIQPLVGLFFWLGGGLVDDDAERQWPGWRRLVRLAGIGLVVGAGLGLLVTGTAVIHPGHPPLSLQVLAKDAFGACVMGSVGAYLIAGFPWQERHPPPHP